MNNETRLKGTVRGHTHYTTHRACSLRAVLNRGTPNTRHTQESYPRGGRASGRRTGVVHGDGDLDNSAQWVASGRLGSSRASPRLDRHALIPEARRRRGMSAASGAASEREARTGVDDARVVQACVRVLQAGAGIVRGAAWAHLGRGPALDRPSPAPPATRRRELPAAGSFRGRRRTPAQVRRSRV